MQIRYCEKWFIVTNPVQFYEPDKICIKMQGGWPMFIAAAYCIIVASILKSQSSECELTLRIVLVYPRILLDKMRSHRYISSFLSFSVPLSQDRVSLIDSWLNQVEPTGTTAIYIIRGWMACTGHSSYTNQYQRYRTFLFLSRIGSTNKLQHWK